MKDWTTYVRSSHGLISYKNITTKCRHLKKFTCKETLRKVFIRVYRLKIQRVMLVFSTQLCELLPLSSSLWFNSPPPFSLPCVKVQNIQRVCGWEGLGVLSPVGGHILQEFNTLYLTRFRTYKIAKSKSPQTKTKGRRLRQINTCSKVLLQAIFFRWHHFILHCILSG